MHAAQKQQYYLNQIVSVQYVGATAIHADAQDYNNIRSAFETDKSIAVHSYIVLYMVTAIKVSNSPIS